MSGFIELTELSGERFHSLVGNIPGIIYQCAMDEHWTMEYISDEVEVLTQYPPSDFLNNKVRTFASIIHPDDLDMVEKVVVSAVKNSQSYTIEYRLLDANEEAHWVYEKGRATYDDRGKPLWLDGIIFDMSTRKFNEQIEAGSFQVLERLAHGAEFEEVLQCLVESIESIWPHMRCSALLLDDDGEHLLHGAAPSLPDFYNEAIHGIDIGTGIGSCGEAAFTGKPFIVEDVMSHPNWVAFRELATKADLRACWSYPILSTQNMVLGTFACYYDTARKPSEIELSGMSRAASLAAIAIQRRREEKELLEAKNSAEKASQAKSEFLSSMSHELRTPLNAIMGFSQLAEYDDELPEEQKKNAHQIYAAGEHLLELVNDILDLAKIDAGKLETKPVKVDVEMALSECCNLVLPLALQHDIKLITDSNDYEGITIIADYIRFKQVLLNLITNAIKYNKPSGSVVIHVYHYGAKRIRIDVTDTGNGLDDRQLERLFQPFERVDEDRASIDGVGIGLVITHRLVEAMGGIISVESKKGQGSTFRVEFERSK